MKPSSRNAVSSLFPLVACLALGAGSAVADSYESRPFSTAELTVTRAYVAYYGRAADPGGLAYWSNRLESEGGSLGSIIGAFGESEEFRQRFGDLSTEDLIRNLYRQLFNRDPDAGGLAYYSRELEAGRRTLQAIALDVLYGATGDDELIIVNKLEVSQYVTSAIESAPRDATDGLDAEAIADLVAQVDQEGDALASLFCRARRVVFDEAAGSLDGQSPAQLAFVNTRGHPDIFSVSFTTEEINDSGRVEMLDLPARRDSWGYNRTTFSSSWFENGYFVNETTHGFGVNMPATTLRPSQFTLCMNEQDVTALIGAPSCEERYDLAGRSYRLLRYDPTDDMPPVTVALEDGLLVAVTAGYALTDSSATSGRLCE